MANICKAKQEAKLLGKSTYYTGKPCKRGHLSPRRVSNNLCIQCAKEIYHITDRDNYRYKDTFYRQYLARKQNSKRLGIPFDIQFSEIETPTHCPVLGIKLNYGWSGEKCRDDTKATIDKLVPELGYVKGNVFVISWRANKLKSNMSLEELRLIIKYIEERINDKGV